MHTGRGQPPPLPHAPNPGCSLGLSEGDNPGLDVVAFFQRVELKMDEAAHSNEEEQTVLYQCDFS